MLLFNEATTTGSHPLTSSLRLKYIAEAAYYLAEKRSFEPGYDVDDWLTAEVQIDSAFHCD